MKSEKVGTWSWITPSLLEAANAPPPRSEIDPLQDYKKGLDTCGAFSGEAPPESSLRGGSGEAQKLRYPWAISILMSQCDPEHIITTTIHNPHKKTGSNPEIRRLLPWKTRAALTNLGEKRSASKAHGCQMVNVCLNAISQWEPTTNNDRTIFGKNQKMCNRWKIALSFPLSLKILHKGRTPVPVAGGAKGWNSFWKIPLDWRFFWRGFLGGGLSRQTGQAGVWKRSLKFQQAVRKEKTFPCGENYYWQPWIGNPMGKKERSKCINFSRL